MSFARAMGKGLVKQAAGEELLQHLLPALIGGGGAALLGDEENQLRNALLGALAGGAGSYGLSRAGGLSGLMEMLRGTDGVKATQGTDGVKATQGTPDNTTGLFKQPKSKPAPIRDATSLQDAVASAMPGLTPKKPVSLVEPADLRSKRQAEKAVKLKAEKAEQAAKLKAEQAAKVKAEQAEKGLMEKNRTTQLATREQAQRLADRQRYASKGVLRGAAGDLYDFFADPADRLLNGAERAGSAVGDAASGVASTVGDAASSAGRAVASVPGKARDVLGTASDYWFGRGDM